MFARLGQILVGVVIGVLFKDDILQSLRSRTRTGIRGADNRSRPPAVSARMRTRPRTPLPDQLIALKEATENFAGKARAINPATDADADFETLYRAYKRLLRQIGLLGAAVGRYGRANPGDWADYFEARYSVTAQIVYESLNESVLNHPAVVNAVDTIGRISDDLNDISKKFASATETVEEIDAALGFFDSLLGFFAPSD